jgi:nucleoside-diphosphate-sugar epimerase
MGEGLKIVVTGGSGFLGRLVVDAVLKRGELEGGGHERNAVDKVVVMDRVEPDGRLMRDRRVEAAVGDVGDPDFVRSAIEGGNVGVFHLASMVSSECELSPERAWSVNVGGARAVLEAARKCYRPPRLVFASSMAVFGGRFVTATVSDETRLTPQTTYGATKAITEMLVSDYTRKGYVDGRSARLPTVVVRPGRPNAAASSWVSGLFREPLAGKECIIPVDKGTRVPITGYRTVVENLLRLFDLDGSRLETDRALNLPALSPSVQEMRETLEHVGGAQAAEKLRFEPSDEIARIFGGWAQTSSFAKSRELGLLVDTNLDDVVSEYLEDLGEARLAFG